MAFPVSIVSIGSFSPLGYSQGDIWQSYLSPRTQIMPLLIGEKKVPVAQLPPLLKAVAGDLRKANPKYYNLDDTVLYAIIASRQAVQKAGWREGDSFGINIGSSRGATQALRGGFHPLNRRGCHCSQPGVSPLLRLIQPVRVIMR